MRCHVGIGQRTVRECCKIMALVEIEELSFAVELFEILFHQFVRAYGLTGSDAVDLTGIPLVESCLLYTSLRSDDPAVRPQRAGRASGERRRASVGGR